MAILVKTVIGFSLISTIYGRKFGFNNSLTCNCYNEDSCQDSGICRNGGCKQGWSGPTCQKENIVYNKPSNQSSIYTPTKLSPLAVDGYIDTGNYSTCTDMNQTKQGWWLVDLQQTYPIKDINIYHSGPHYLSRLEGFSVYIIGEDLVSTLCYHHTNENLTAEYKIRCNITGRYINITSAVIPDYNSLPDGVLNLCEVGIYVCSLGTYGSDCLSYCHCSQYTRCDHITGHCKDGCLAGWHGNSCNQKCEVGFYGDGCVYMCSERQCFDSLSSTCHHITGKCEAGCREGYDGIDCMAIARRTTSSYQQLGTTKDTYITIVVLSSVCSLLLGIGLAIACVFLYRRCHKNNATGNEIPRNNVISPVISHDAIEPRGVYEDLSSPEADRQNVYQDLSLDKEDVNDTLTDLSYYNTIDKTNMKYVNTEILASTGANTNDIIKSEAP